MNDIVCAYCSAELDHDWATTDSEGHLFCDGACRESWWSEADAP